MTSPCAVALQGLTAARCATKRRHTNARQALDSWPPPKRQRVSASRTTSNAAAGSASATRRAMPESSERSQQGLHLSLANPVSASQRRSTVITPRQHQTGPTQESRHDEALWQQRVRQPSEGFISTSVAQSLATAAVDEQIRHDQAMALHLQEQEVAAARVQEQSLAQTARVTPTAALLALQARLYQQAAAQAGNQSFQQSAGAPRRPADRHVMPEGAYRDPQASPSYEPMNIDSDTEQQGINSNLRNEQPQGNAGIMSSDARQVQWCLLTHAYAKHACYNNCFYGHHIVLSP